MVNRELDKAQKSLIFLAFWEELEKCLTCNDSLPVLAVTTRTSRDLDTVIGLIISGHFAPELYQADWWQRLLALEKYLLASSNCDFRNVLAALDLPRRRTFVVMTMVVLQALDTDEKKRAVAEYASATGGGYLGDWLIAGMAAFARSPAGFFTKAMPFCWSRS